MVLAYRLMSGEMVSSVTGREMKLGEGYKATSRMDIIQRFLESKEAPVASFITGVARGKDSTGQPFNIPAEIIDRMIPMMAQDMVDLYGEWGPEGLFMALPGVFGVGSQTYTGQIPMKSKTSTGKETTKWRNKPSIGERVMLGITGEKLSDIPSSKWDKLYQERLEELKNKAEIDNAILS